MSQKKLIEQLAALQLEAQRRGYDAAWRWLGKAIAKLMEESKPKRRRPRGRWVTLAATGERAFLDASVIQEALKENGERR